MNIGDILEVKIIDVDNFGNGIAKEKGEVIFVKGTLLNETVSIKIDKVNKKYLNASIVKIIEKSPERKEVSCPYYNICGGCSFLHTTIDNENNIKENYIKRLFKEEKVNGIVQVNEYNYRNKVTLHVKNKKLGFYKENTNDLVEIDKCILLDELINKYILIFKKYDLSKVKSIMIRSNSKEVLIKLDGSLNDKDLLDLIKNKDLCSLYFNEKFIYGNEYLVFDIEGIKYTVYPDSFFQVNTLGMIRLYTIIKEFSSGDKLLDLYCGTGTIGIYLHERFKYILGVEKEKSSIKNAKLNKKINKLNNIEFMLSNSKDVKDSFDFVIVDPPRIGLSKTVITNLIEIGSTKIIYVSCNPNTLKRDIDMLKESYKVISITPVNMFPKTMHVESVCVLEKK